MKLILAKAKFAAVAVLASFFVSIHLPAVAQQAPIADAGPDLIVTEGSYVQLDGSASNDPNPGLIETSFQSDNLPGGTSLDVAITGLSDDGGINFSAALGEGVSAPNTAITYIIDVSGSANFAGGCAGDQNGDNRFNTRLDCEIAAALALHAEVEASGSVQEVGLISFSWSGRTIDLNPLSSASQFLIEPSADADGNGVGDLEQALRRLRAGGGTNFYSAVNAACNLLAGSQSSNRIAIMISDGEATSGSAAVNRLPCDPDVKFETFAIGSGADCDRGRVGSTLQEIADQTGGNCTNVPDVANLPDILPEVILSQITRATLTINDQPSIDISDVFDPALPVTGPVNFDLATSLPALDDGLYDVCIEVFAQDSGGEGSVETCSRLRVGDAPLTYQWSIIETNGLPVVLSSTTQPTPGFLALDDASYIIELEVTNAFGLSATDTVGVEVANADPIMQVEAELGNAGDITLVNASFTDVGFLDSHSAVIDWGDGSTDAVDVTAQGSGWGGFFGTHIYQSPGTYQITLTLTDDDGGQTSSTLQTIEVGSAIAVWANSSNASKTIDWTGGSGAIEGAVHSNNVIKLAGSTKSFTGPVSHGNGISGNLNKHQFSETPVEVGVLESAIVYDIADYQPGGVVSQAVGSAYFDMSSQCQGGTWHQTQTVLSPGVYYANCDIKLNGSNIGGRITLASEGSIDISGSRPAFEPFYEGLLFLSAANNSKAVDISTSNSKFLGVVYGIDGEIEVAGSGNQFYCAMIGDTLDLSGNSLSIRGADCGPSGTSVAGPLLVPNLNASLTVDSLTGLPGQVLDYQATLSNDGSFLIVPGVIGLENVDTTAVTVNYYAYVLEYFSISANQWVSIATQSAAAPGYTPTDPVVELGGIQLSSQTNPNGGVSYGLLDDFLGTQISPEGYATWGVQANVEINTDLVNTLLDVGETAAIRNRVLIETSPSSAQVRHLYNYGDDFIEDLRALSGDITDLSLTQTLPSGDPILVSGTAELLNLAPGQSVTIDSTYPIEMLAPRGVTEPSNSYIERLSNQNGSLLSGSIFVIGQGGVGALVAPVDFVNSELVLPIVNHTVVGEANAVPGSVINYDLTTSQLGSVAATQVTNTTQINGAALTLSPSIPAELNVGQIINSTTTASIASDAAAGSLVFRSGVSWQDSLGNAYGPVDADILGAITLAPSMAVTLTDMLAIDADANGLVSPGDTLEFQAVLSNEGDLALTNVNFSIDIDAGLNLVAGSVSTTSGSVTTATAPTVEVSIGSIAGSASATVSFQALIPANLPSTQVSATHQGVATSDQSGSVLSDDPAASGVDNPTVTRIAFPNPVFSALLSVEQTQDADGNGYVSAGDQLKFSLDLSNVGTSAALNTLIEVPIPGSTQLVAGSIQTSSGNIDQGNAAGDTMIVVSLPVSAADSNLMLEFLVQITNPVNPATNVISTRAQVSADNADLAFSDDPNTVEENDPTEISVITDPGVGGTTGGSSGGGGTTGGGSGGSNAGAASTIAGQSSADFSNGLPGSEVSSLEPINGSILTGTSTVSASLTPPSGETVESWTVYIRPIGSTELIPVGTGSGSNVSVDLDTTVYANGMYGLVIESTSSGGGVVRSESYITVEGDLKPGRIQFSIVDVSIELDRLPVSIVRSYDSFNRNSADFGYAWELEIADFRIESNGFLGDGGWRQEAAGGALFISYLNFVTDKPHFVAVTWPDGTVERFDLKPTQTINLFPFQSSAEFVARDGATSKLEALDSYLFYNGDGNLYSGLFGSGSVYNPQRFRLTDRFGTEYIIDRQGGLQTATDINGNTLTINNNGISHSLGTNVQFVRDASNRITQIIDPEGHTLNYQYDAIGNLVSVTDQAGEDTLYEYDSTLLHHIVKITDADDGKSELFEYDADGRIVAMTDVEGETLTTNYDPNTLSLAVVNRRGFTTTEFYDASGNLARTEYPDGSSTQYSYDDPNNPYDVTTEINENGGVTESAYAANGDLLAVTNPDGTQSLFEYDERGNVLKTTDPSGNTRLFSYDAKGNLLSFINEEGQVGTSTYDSSGRVITRVAFNGTTTTYSYSGNYPFPSRVTHADGSFRDITYDLTGRITYLKDENGNTSRAAYNALGNMTFVENSAGERVNYEYSNGNLVRLSTTVGGEVLFDYDASNRLIRRENDLGDITTFTYDENGNRTSVTDENGNVTQYVYDSRDRLIEEISPTNQSSFYVYDPAGYLISETDANGRTKQYEYTSTGELTTETWFDSNGNQVRQVNTTHDDSGNVLSASDNNSSFEYQYDRLDRVLRSVDTSIPGQSWTLDFGYDAGGGLASIVDQQGVSVASNFNSEKLLDSMSWSGGSIDGVEFGLNYTPIGQIDSVTRTDSVSGNDVVESSYSYNDTFNVTNVTHNDGNASAINQFDYSYDNFSKLASEDALNGSRVFTYDALGQIVGVSSTGIFPNESYAYDAAGNRVDGQTVTTAGNRLASNAEFDYQYDNVGNVIERTHVASGERASYEYDLNNQLTDVDVYDASAQLIQSTDIIYDVFGRVLSRSHDSDGDGPRAATSQYRTYAGPDLWADLDGAGNIDTRYLYMPGIDNPVARYRTGEGSAFYLTDRQGSVRAVVDSSGALVNQIDYDSFGNIVNETNVSDGDRLKYTAREYDADIGLYDYRSRHYDATVGRFMSPDSVGFDSGDFNLYRYVFNAPNQYTDPFGTTSSVEYATLNATQQAARRAAIECVRNVVLTLAKEAAVEMLTIYTIRQAGKLIPYVGRTSRTTNLRFAEHAKTGRFGGGLKQVGIFNIRIPQLPDPKDTQRLIRVIEQMVMEEFGGKTKLLNARNEINAKDYKKYRKIFCGKP